MTNSLRHLLAPRKIVEIELPYYCQDALSGIVLLINEKEEILLVNRSGFMCLFEKHEEAYAEKLTEALTECKQISAGEFLQIYHEVKRLLSNAVFG